MRDCGCPRCELMFALRGESLQAVFPGPLGPGLSAFEVVFLFDVQGLPHHGTVTYHVFGGRVFPDNTSENDKRCGGVPYVLRRKDERWSSKHPIPTPEYPYVHAKSGGEVPVRPACFFYALAAKTASFGTDVAVVGKRVSHFSHNAGLLLYRLDNQLKGELS